ncbi:MAG: NUDIX domain-containing protein [Candidatus Aenigmarchaeota archaeon]|nr:NUDIX domain-containing protein [Candidatus Aenigmarchaeota archaeon]
MDNFRLAVKAFIVKDGKLLLIRRRWDDVHKPDKWDIPGGRLEPGEDPFEGLKREVKEEINMDGLETLMPIEIKHFTRDDGQKITMIIFLCRISPGKIGLSKEHREYRWVDLHNPDGIIPGFFMPAVEKYLKYGLDKIS